MDPKEIFVLGVKLIGVYCLALAIERAFMIPWGFIRVEQLDNSVAIYKFLPWIPLITPILLGLLGRYLILDGRCIHDVVFSQDIAIGKTESLFNLGLALYGVLILAGSIPLVINVVSKIGVVLLTPPYVSTEIEMDGIKSDLLPTLATIGLAFVCLRNGRYFTRLAFHRSLKDSL